MTDIAGRLGLGEIGFLGFGEAAQAFAGGMTPKAKTGAVAFDLKLLSSDTKAQKATECAAFNVIAAATCAEMAGAADCIFSLVTADQAAEAAREAAKFLRAGSFFFDGNSCAPETKIANAKAIAKAGGRYVDLAIMAPVHPGGLRTPVSVSGPDSQMAAELLQALGMNVTLVPGEVGRASAIKMVRSIMVKGLEALSAECGLAARRAGVEEAVFQSLEKSYPGFGFENRTAYNLERMIVHGARRAAEMVEVVKTLDDLNLPSDMASATVNWQSRVSGLHLEPGPDSLDQRLDLVSDALKQEDKK